MNTLLSIRSISTTQVSASPALLGVILALAVAGSAFAGEIPRTSWGAPDLQGTYDFKSITPFERPKQFGNKEVLTAKEVEEYEAKARLASVERRKKINSEDFQSQGDLDVGYNAIFLDKGFKMTGTRRTSLVVDPPNGRMPALTEDAKSRSTARIARWGQLPGSTEDRNPLERCIQGFNAGPPMNPGAYNNFVEVFQSKDHVALVTEMINDHRVIPLDGRDHVSQDIRLWKGDSRGHWDGDTLVVRTKNFTDQTNFRGSGMNMILEERFTREDNGNLRYEYTVTDPESFANPFSVAMEMVRTEDPLLEYACHEGNRAMTLMLRGARVREAKGDTDASDWLASWYGGAKAVKAAEDKLKEAGATEK